MFADLRLREDDSVVQNSNKRFKRTVLHLRLYHFLNLKFNILIGKLLPIFAVVLHKKFMNSFPLVPPMLCFKQIFVIADTAGEDEF